MANGRLRCRDERVCRCNGIDGAREPRCRFLKTVDLFGGEDRRGACQEARFDLTVRAVAGVFERLVEDDVAGGLSLADLGAGLGPLPVGAPAGRGETAFQRCGPQGKNIDALIGLLRGDIDGAQE